MYDQELADFLTAAPLLTCAQALRMLWIFRNSSLEIADCASLLLLLTRSRIFFVETSKEP